MSRPIPIKSPREASTLARGSSRISQSLPVPNSPHFGSLKAPPEFLTGMPPLALPMSFQENEERKWKKDVMARSAPSVDLEPIHRYKIEDKRKKKEEGSLSSSLGVSLKSSAGGLAASLSKGMNALNLDDSVIEEGDETSSPQVEERGVLLSTIQQKFGITPPKDIGDDLDELDLNDEDELQFELS